MSPHHDGTSQPPPEAEGSDPEALGEEREEYPDPESYPSSHGSASDVTDGTTPDADLQVDAEEP